MENNELVEALRMKIEALEMKNEALQIKIEALELRNSTSQLMQSRAASGEYTEQEGEFTEDQEQTEGKKRGRKTKGTSSVARLQAPLEAEIRNMLSGERFNRATYRAITGILLCLYENGKGNVNVLYDYVGGSRVTIVRHTALMKKLDLLRYEGSRKKGFYVLTDHGKEVVSQVAAQA